MLVALLKMILASTQSPGLGEKLRKSMRTMVIGGNPAGMSLFNGLVGISRINCIVSTG